ncbi:MAG: sel1 repeat family protein [Proteobacteria bacterium]|nr:sel1 repeat family protein [Pseudomonadota bacterium]
MKLLNLLFPRIRLSSVALGLLCLVPISPALADYEAGVNAAFDGDYDTAYREFTIAAETGLDVAQYNLGILYFTGRGVDVDYDQAFKWTSAAADQGHIAALFNLGSLYFSGHGTGADEDKAVELYSRSARSGSADAAITLARMYRDGESVSADPVQAHAWASMALNHEHIEAASLRDEIERGMNSQQMSEARRLFARWQIQ